MLVENANTLLIYRKDFSFYTENYLKEIATSIPTGIHSIYLIYAGDLRQSIYECECDIFEEKDVEELEKKKKSLLEQKDIMEKCRKEKIERILFIN